MSSDQASENCMDYEQRKTRKLSIGLFVFGILLAIMGWHVDKAEHFPRLLRIISPDYADGSYALNALAANVKHALTAEYPGFHALVQHWPELKEKRGVFLIGRSSAFTDFAPVIKNDFLLIARDKDGNELGHRWSYVRARELFAAQFAQISFLLGTIVFYVGVAISLLAGIAEFVMPAHGPRMDRPATQKVIPVSIVCKNNLLSYLGTWFTVMCASSKKNKEIVKGFRWPQPIQALQRQELSLCIILKLLHDRLWRVENSAAKKEFDFTAYAEAMTFLDATYLFVRVLMNSIAGVLRCYYKLNTKRELPTDFSDLLKKAKDGKLPEDLNGIILECDGWFSELQDRRDDIVHHFETYFLAFSQDAEGQITPYQLSTRVKTRAKPHEDIRSYIGETLSGYQQLIDSLLAHLDMVFKEWYGIVSSFKSQQSTILGEPNAYILWWAWKYGGYENGDMEIKEEIESEGMI